MRKLFILLIPFLILSIFTFNSYSQDAKVIELTLDSYEFTPDTIVVEVNKPVEIRLKSTTFLTPHNLTIDAPESGINVSKDIGAGDEGIVRFTPTKTGSYEFYCDKKSIFADHRKKGMVGTLEVVDKSEK